MKKICAGVVTYCPDLELLEVNFQALLQQVAQVFVVDNGSVNSSDLATLSSRYSGISLIFNDENLGIAKALNQLCQQAKEHGFDWILTLDQDSVCAPQMVKSLQAHTISPCLGIIAPRVEFRDGEKLIFSTKDGDKDTLYISACITSGSLTKVKAWENVGGFDEWMFIDKVDNEFCIRLGRFGYSILRDNKAVLYQRAGEMKYATLPLIGTVLLPYYNEKRNYFICRNTVYYLRKHWKYTNSIHQVGAFVYSQCIKLTLESHRWATIRSTYRGIRDGFKKNVVS